jgi:hypothetical protein
MPDADVPDADESDAVERRERTFRGISLRLARHYLTNLGGEAVSDREVRSGEWAATLSEASVSVGPSLTLNEVTVVFEGEPSTLDSLVERFAQKAVRAGG